MKRVITLIAVVFLGIIIGVSVVTKQANEPAMRMMLQQQEELLSAQERIENKLFPSQEPVFLDKQGKPINQGSSAVNNIQLKALEARVSQLENKIGGLEKALQGFAKQQKRQGPPPEDYTKVHDIDISKSPIKGNKKAPVTIIEFSDLECPYCARFHNAVKEVLKVYPKDVNFVLKHFPLSFHKNARSAAKATLAANEQGKFFEMVDILLDNFKNLNDELYENTAKDLGLNVKKFLKDYKEKCKVGSNA